MQYNKQIRIGNFILEKESIDNRSLIKIWTLANHWSVSYWENNPVFPLIDSESETG